MVIPLIRYDMFRHQLEYLNLIDRIKTALIGVGAKWNNYKPEDLIHCIHVEGLEELMLATWAMNKLIVKYLKRIDSEYQNGHKIIDLYTAIGNLVGFLKSPMTNPSFLSDEAAAMEQVSRACYAWMKSFRMLKGQKIAQEAFGWPMMRS